MCGIIAVKGSEPVSKVLVGLKQLEYRGYDSCGIACKERNNISIFKSVGYVDNLSSTGVKDIKCNLAIGHTRWATHGVVSIENSHPHSSADGAFAIVHNGIIENYLELKSKYLKGIKFSSGTDSEVIAQLVQYFYRGSVWEAFKSTVQVLRGSYAIVMISEYDNNLYFARCRSPLAVGKSKGEYALSSDINGFDGISQIAYINDESIGYIDNNIHIYDKKFKKYELKFCDNIKHQKSVDKGGYEHYMIKEIYEIPKALENCYKSISGATFTLPSKIENILMVSCGTSYHSSLMGKKYIENIAGIPVDCEIASEYIYNSTIVKPNTLGIFISQSGETADTLSALRKAKGQGLYTLAITNVENSSIVHLSDTVLYLNAGAEICVASTKAYTSQVFAMLLLSNILLNVAKGNYIAESNLSIAEPSETTLSNLLSQTSQSDISTTKPNITMFSKSSLQPGKRNVSKTESSSTTQIQSLSQGTYGGLSLIEPSRTIDYLGIDTSGYEKLYNLDIAGLECMIDKVAGVIASKNELHLIGKDYDYVTSMEGSLKIKEVSYIFTDAYPCGELKHGTLSLIDNDSIVIAISTIDRLWDKVENSINEIVSRGGKVFVVSQLDIASGNFSKITLPSLNKWLMPIVSIIPIDLIAYKVATAKGCNPDKPRNLAKSVTVE